MVIRLIPLLIIIFVLSLLTLSFSDMKNEVMQKLGLYQSETKSCCSVDQVLSADGSFDENANIAIFEGKPINFPKTSLARQFENSLTQSFNEDSAVLGTTTEGGKEKWIEVSLNEQKVRAYEGDKIVMEFPVSSGKWSPTPKGTFNIWYKTRSQTMSGGQGADYYYLPGVPHNMFFYGGYALHGAYWHNNFGSPMSHGCVNEPLAYAEKIFDWAGPVVPPGQNVVRASAENPGTKVYIH